MKNNIQIVDIESNDDLPLNCINKGFDEDSYQFHIQRFINRKIYGIYLKMN